MIAQFISVFYISLSSIVVGAAIKRIAGWHLPLIHMFLLGFSCCNAVFTLLSLFYPINYGVQGSFFIAVILILSANTNYILKDLRNTYKQIVEIAKKNGILFIIAIVFIVILFFQSLYSPALHYDAGLYHIQTIKWIETYPTIPGLAALNYTFGYNFNIFTWYAASSLQGLFNQPVYAVNFTLTLFFCLHLFGNLYKLINQKAYFFGGGFLLILYSFVLYYVPHISTTTNNLPVFVLLITCLISLSDLERNKEIALSIIILSVYAVTIKLSAIPGLLLAAFFLLKAPAFSTRKQLLITWLLTGFILIPWLCKNVLLTGWIIYPFPAVDLFSFRWKVPVEDVIRAKETVKYFAQGNSNNPKSGWFMSWLLRQKKTDVVIMVLVILTTATLVFQLFARKLTLTQYQHVGILVSIAGIAFMFLNAPNLSYSIAFFLGLIVLSVKEIRPQLLRGKYVFYGVSTIMLFLFLGNAWYHPWHFVKHISDRILVPYPLDEVHNRKFEAFMIDGRIKCYYPLGSDQCFDHELPCTYEQNLQLHLIGETINQGFYKLSSGNSASQINEANH